ncbi:serine/threonine-protein kinase [Nocardioides humilatus]|uniref:serine/threonine-protein kinase n=1 Tax=Nocardioides humilatus TaxID=2607660 RepID=UPI00165FA652|nr:serine/threonine-protein kinase [Nocardioides humilatus]
MLPGVGSDFGRYRITGQLGRGGMGVVFSAVHQGLERSVALKLLTPELSNDDSYRRRFLREAKILARLDSPFVVRVYDAGDQDGLLFIATELIAGGDLAELTAAGGPLPAPEAVALVAQVAKGLSVAHDNGILHRDIKPSNVLIRRLGDGSQQAVLCDLGIAMAVDIEATSRTIGVAGTPSYMSPERLNGEDATVATDIYAVGCVLWAALTGYPPYLGTPAEIYRGHVYEAIPQLPPGPLSSEINAILLTAMAKNPASRFSTAADLRAALLAAGRSGGSDGLVELADVPAADSTSDTVVAPFVFTEPPPAPPPAAPPTVAPPVAAPPIADPTIAPARWVPPVVAAPPPAPPPVPPPVERTHGGSRKGALVAALIVGAIVLGGAVAGAVVMLGNDDKGGPDPDASGPRSSTAAPRKTDRPSQAPTKNGAPKIECWDGSTARTARQCPAPAGVQGIAWMYPSFERSECGRARPTLAKLAVWQCYGQTSSGDQVLIRYNEWRSPALAEASYASKDRGSNRELVRSGGRVVQTVWRYDGVNREGRVTLSVVYSDWPFSVSVEGDSARAIEDGLQELVVQRDSADVLVR